jgi:hypothetical protein
VGKHLYPKRNLFISVLISVNRTNENEHGIISPKDEAGDKVTEILFL